MVFAAKTKGSNQRWGMGFLFVFLPENDDNNILTKKKTNFSSSSSSPLASSSSPSPSPSPSFKQPFTALLKRPNSTQLVATAQSTISICALLFFVTLLGFTLSTFEPSATSHHHRFLPRRQLSSAAYTAEKTSSYVHGRFRALQGMGTLYRRGTRAMNELVVAHVAETLTLHELRVFLRLFHRSGLTSRSDLVFISSPSSKSSLFDSAVFEENDAFLKLVESYLEETKKNGSELTRPSSFDVTQLLKSSKKEKESGEPIWGKKIRGNSSGENETELTRPSYGSVVGFDVDELDPENSLAGFLDHVPMSLRRWACYPMLLGRLKRNFKQIMLVDAKEVILLGDPLSRVRNRSPETVHLSTITHPSSGRHGKKNSEKTQSKHVDPGIIMGGARGVRRLSSAMLTEIARAAMQHKKKNPVTEFGLFGQLAGNENLLKNVNLVIVAESIPELSSLTRLNSKSGSSSLSIKNLTVVRRGNSNMGVDSIITRHICSFPLESKVYSDCSLVVNEEFYRK